LAAGCLAPQRQEQRAVALLCDAATEVQAAGHHWLLAENHRHVLQLLAVGAKPGACQRRAVTAVGGFAVAEVQLAVVGKAAVAHHVQQAALAAGIHRRHAGHPCQAAAIGVQQPQLAAPLAHQHATLIDKGQRPRVVQLVVQHLAAYSGGLGVGQ
jgi:hypothetical protein